jgi:hypothetical protein
MIKQAGVLSLEQELTNLQNWALIIKFQVPLFLSACEKLLPLLLLYSDFTSAESHLERYGRLDLQKAIGSKEKEMKR